MATAGQRASMAHLFINGREICTIPLTNTINHEGRLDDNDWDEAIDYDDLTNEIGNPQLSQILNRHAEKGDLIEIEIEDIHGEDDQYDGYVLVDLEEIKPLP